MASARSPPYKRQTPTNKPELLEIWRKMYRALHFEGDLKKSDALETIGKQYGVSRQTVMYHLFPAYKKIQQKRPSQKWVHQKSDREIRKKVTNYKAKYQNARNHIDELIIKAYHVAAHNDLMSLENLSDSIHEVCGISFHPDVIHGLVNRFESRKDQRLLVEVHGSDPQSYRLSESFL